MLLESKIREHIREVQDFPQKGVSYKDIGGIFHDAQLSNEIIEDIAKEFQGKIDVVCGVESRGFIFGFPIALAMQVPFVMVRKKGKLPPPVISYDYELEYGNSTLELSKDSLPEGARCLIHDDVLATGGTAKATANLVREAGAESVSFSFLIALDYLKGEDKLKDYGTIHTLVHYSE